MHDWSETDFDWEGLNNAGIELETFCRRYGRIGMHTKEKWGTLRAYTYFCCYPILHSLIYPGYVYSQFPAWLWHADLRLLSPCLNLLMPLIRKWQYFIYRKGYERVVKHYPHLEDEILSQVDYYELLKKGSEIEKKYWEIVRKNNDTDT